MSYKNKIITVMTLLILLLLMMSTTIQAANVGKVYNLNATMDGSQMKLTWGEVSNAIGYNVYVNNTKIGSVTSNAATLIGFIDNTTYNFKVAAYDEQRNEGAWSNEITVTTGGTNTLEKVTNVTVTQTNAIVTLNWSSVDRADKYQIFVDIPNLGETYIGEVTTNSVMLGGFKEGHRYGFSIRACQFLNSGSVNYGNKSSMQYCTINSKVDNSDGNKDEQEDIGTVKNVQVFDITETEATITWSKNSNADGYEVKLSRNGGFYKTIKDTTRTTAYLYDLYEDSNYKVKIFPYKEIKGKRVYGEESYYKSFKTDVKEDYTPAQVKNLSVSDITENSAYISWSRVNNATGYNIYVSEDYGKFKYWDSTNSKNYTLKGLEQNIYYKVKVEAYRKVNGTEYIGNYSSTKTFTTLKKETEIKPDTVTHLNAEVRNRNEAYLTWWPIEGELTGYAVYISEEGSSYEYLTYTNENHIILTSDMLDYSTNYKVKVRAYKNYYANGKMQTVYGRYSNVESFKTQKRDKTENSSKVGKVTGVNAYMKEKTTVNLRWNKIYGASGYEIDFTVPGIGHVTLYSNSNSRDVSGVTGKDYDYTARIRAYKYINGVKTYGPYSDVVKFRER